MATSTHSVEVNASLQGTWEYISNFGNWAPLIEGYVSHEVVSDSEAKWEILGDFGFVKKQIVLAVDQITRVDQEKISFKLSSKAESLDGSGSFILEVVDAEKTKITGTLDISAGGFMGMMINNVLQTFVPKITPDLVGKIGDKVTEKVVG